MTERHGWDGFFIWDHLFSRSEPAVDAVTVLAAVAQATNNISLGPLVVPLARRRPWKVARELLTLDQLSGGRLIWGVGLGFPPEEFTDFGESGNVVTRAEKLDEGVEIVQRLLTGEQVSFSGAHFKVDAIFSPPAPREIMMVSALRWPSEKLGPVRRAVKLGAAFPVSNDFARDSQLSVEEISRLRTHLVESNPDRTSIEIFHAGSTSNRNDSSDREVVQEYADSGVSWWLESFDMDNTIEDVRNRIAAGPPRPG